MARMTKQQTAVVNFQDTIRRYVDGESTAIEALTHAVTDTVLTGALLELIQEYEKVGGKSCVEIKRVRAALRAVPVEDDEQPWTVKFAKEAGWTLTRATPRGADQNKATAASELKKLITKWGIEEVAAACIGHGGLAATIATIARNRKAKG